MASLFCAAVGPAVCVAGCRNRSDPFFGARLAFCAAVEAARAGFGFCGRPGTGGALRGLAPAVSRVRRLLRCARGGGTLRPPSIEGKEDGGAEDPQGSLIGGRFGPRLPPPSPSFADWLPVRAAAGDSLRDFWCPGPRREHAGPADNKRFLSARRLEEVRACWRIRLVVPGSSPCCLHTNIVGALRTASGALHCIDGTEPGKGRSGVWDGGRRLWLVRRRAPEVPTSLVELKHPGCENWWPADPPPPFPPGLCETPLLLVGLVELTY
ncbi:hypothetical protein NDU88_008896 [Pleurodeles waltl]|uniref:Uncharacterized protein n=1 Tax=Pleurodeles waltl TaxID=8319 RepID=A0AAV7RWU7_PLEWA|nr:hypothetical protein NDU88_008896 [Pleurodeles waltl]